MLEPGLGMDSGGVGVWFLSTIYLTLSNVCVLPSPQSQGLMASWGLWGFAPCFQAPFISSELVGTLSTKDDWRGGRRQRGVFLTGWLGYIREGPGSHLSFLDLLESTMFASWANVSLIGRNKYCKF